MLCSVIVLSINQYFFSRFFSVSLLIMPCLYSKLYGMKLVHFDNLLVTYTDSCVRLSLKIKPHHWEVLKLLIYRGTTQLRELI